MDRSIGYDRVADVYDATRALPQAVQRKLTDALVGELATVGPGEVLEVGVGTGRISRPLALRGIRLCGVDIAPRMLAKLREQLGPEHAPPDLVLGDATRLPLAPASFRAVLVFHVLHLVSSMERAVGELRRVVAPGGALIRGCSRYLGESPWEASDAKWSELTAKSGLSLSTGSRPQREQIRGALLAAGGSCRTQTCAEYEERSTPAQHLDRIRNRVENCSWEIPEHAFAACLKEFEPWYRRHYGDMDGELAQAVSYELEVWSFGEEPGTT